LTDPSQHLHTVYEILREATGGRFDTGIRIVHRIIYTESVSESEHEWQIVVPLVPQRRRTSLQEAWDTGGVDTPVEWISGSGPDLVPALANFLKAWYDAKRAPHDPTGVHPDPVGSPAPSEMRDPLSASPRPDPLANATAKPPDPKPRVPIRVAGVSRPADRTKA
jgi:hypothetical protein